MRVTLTKEEFAVLLPLIDRRLAEFYAEIRHAVVSAFKDDLRRRKRNLLMAREALKQARGVDVELSDEQVAALVELIRENLHEIPEEIRHSGSADWRDELREQKEVLQTLLHRLAPESASAGSTVI